jgi:hypothetical protein
VRGPFGECGGSNHSGSGELNGSNMPWCATDSISLSTSAPGSPGDASQIHFDSRLTFLVSPNGWVPQAIALTLPNTSGQLQTPWTPGGIPITRQDAAIHPGSYVGPLQLTVDPPDPR